MGKSCLDPPATTLSAPAAGPDWGRDDGSDRPPTNAASLLLRQHVRWVDRRGDGLPPRRRLHDAGLDAPLMEVDR